MKDFPRLYGAPLLDPEKAKELLRDPEVQWKPRYSAYEAAHSWIGAGKREGGGLPQKVRELLKAAPEWSNAKVVAGFFEHGTALDTQMWPSSNDLLVVTDLGAELGLIAVEAKAKESFGPVVRGWMNSDGTRARYRWACEEFDLNLDRCLNLRWQLFHRTLSALIETKRFHAKHAMMLVHQFNPDESSARDYADFADAIGMPDARLGTISAPRVIKDVSLRLAWVRDEPRP